MKSITVLLLAVGLAGCSSLTFEPDKTGAEHECASHSAHLADYNACMARVDSEYRAYELQRKLDDQEEN